MTWHLTKILTVRENFQVPAVCKGSPCQNGGHCDFADDLQACFSLKIYVFLQDALSFNSNEASSPASWTIQSLSNVFVRRISWATFVNTTRPTTSFFWFIRKMHFYLTAMEPFLIKLNRLLIKTYRWTLLALLWSMVKHLFLAGLILIRHR